MEKIHENKIGSDEGRIEQLFDDGTMKGALKSVKLRGMFRRACENHNSFIDRMERIERKV